MNGIKGKKKSPICEFCNKEFANSSSLSRHTKIHLGDKKFKCSFCDYGTIRKDVLTSHLRTHTQEKPYKCPEPDCDYSANQTSNLKTHSLVHSEGKEKPFACKLCPYTKPNA